MAEFDLNALIRSTLQDTEEPDPHVIAQVVFSKVPKTEYAAIVERSMVRQVRLIVHEQRPSVSGRDPQAPGESWAAGAARMIALTRERRFVPARGEWMLLRDMTAPDCLSVAADHRERAAHEEAVAERFERLALLLGDDPRATVADLDLELAGATT